MIKFIIDYSGGVPIYRQIIDQIRFGIASGQLKLGEQLPTVRALAVELKVNLNTVSKAYKELEIRKILETQQGTGTFINQTEQRVYSIAWNVSEHFRDTWQGTKFKGMLVTPRKSIAVLYKKYLDEIGMVSSEVLITAPDMREGEDSSYGETSAEVKAYWKKMMDEHGTPKKYQDNLIRRFKESESPEIMIVVDKLLTGFDEPKVVVMYLDRKLNGHTLLQTVARVNRVCDDKDFGYIIDYYGVLKELDEAMDLYSNYDEEEQQVFRETLESVNMEIGKLPTFVMIRKR